MKKLVIIVFIISLLVCQTAASLSACEFFEEQSLDLGAQTTIDDSILLDPRSGAQKTMDVVDIVTAPLIPLSFLGGFFSTFAGVSHAQRLYNKATGSGPNFKSDEGFSAGDVVFFMELSPKSKNKLNK